MSDPQPIPESITALTARAEAVATEVSSIREQVGPYREELKGKVTADNGVDVHVLYAVQDGWLAAADRLVEETRASLSPLTPDSLPETPEGLSGNPLQQALLAEQVLAVLNAERGEDGHFTNRAAREQAGLWQEHLRTVEEPARRLLTDLTERLNSSVDRCGSLIPRDRETVPASRRRSAWR